MRGPSHPWTKSLCIAPEELPVWEGAEAAVLATDRTMEAVIISLLKEWVARQGRCRKCGRHLAPEWRYCAHCGCWLGDRIAGGGNG